MLKIYIAVSAAQLLKRIAGKQNRDTARDTKQIGAKAVYPTSLNGAAKAASNIICKRNIIHLRKTQPPDSPDMGSILAQSNQRAISQNKVSALAALFAPNQAAFALPNQRESEGPPGIGAGRP